MKSFISILAAGVLGFFAALPVQAASLAKIKEAGVFRIGTEGTYPPFTYHDSDNKLVGFDVEIGRAIAEKLGVEAQFMEGKWDGLIYGAFPQIPTAPRRRARIHPRPWGAEPPPTATIAFRNQAAMNRRHTGAAVNRRHTGAAVNRRPAPRHPSPRPRRLTFPLPWRELSRLPIECSS